MEKDFQTVVKENAKRNPYPTKSIGKLKLKRSILPDDALTKPTFHLDDQSHLGMAAKALSLGLTTDELYRVVVWSYLSL